MRRLRLLLATLLLCLPAVAYGIRFPYANDRPVEGPPGWPPGLKELINLPQRVFGYNHDFEDVFFFAGDSGKLHEFVKGFAKLPKVELQIALHAGRPEVKIVPNEPPRDIAADWKLVATSSSVKLDIWTGGQVDLAKLLLILPPDVPVDVGEDAAGDDKEKLENLLRKLRARHDAQRVASGVYKIAADKADGANRGVKVQRYDSSGTVTLTERMADKLGTASIVSENNDNSRFRLHLSAAGPIAEGSDQGNMAIVVAGYCALVWSHSDRRADGTMDLVATIVGRRAADRIAAELNVKPQLRAHPGHQWTVSFRPEKDGPYHVGEPVTLEMKITNVGQTPINFMDGGMQRGPRNNQFQFNAFRTHGHGPAVPDTGDPNHHGGIAGFIRLAPGRVFTKSVKLSDWFKFDKPDTYRATGMFRVELSVGENRRAWDDFAVGECQVVVVEGAAEEVQIDDR